MAPKNPTTPVVAPAKINLFLRILSRETSGYHQIETAFALPALLHLLLPLVQLLLATAYLLQLMLVRGTTRRTGPEIVEAADRMGGSIDAYADADYAEIPATALSRYWGEMLDLVAEVALRPTLPDGTTKRLAQKPK